MARFRIARLLGAVLTISVMTGNAALPVMAAEEIASTAETPQESLQQVRLPSEDMQRLMNSAGQSLRAIQ